MLPLLAWVFAIPLLGFLTGLRCMTPIAVLCWFAYAGHLGIPGHVLRSASPGASDVHGTGIHDTWAFWTAYLVTCVVFTVLAIGEYVGDKLPNTPNRTSAFPLIARVCFGGLVGALAATSLTGSAIEGAFLGAIGALAGTFIGFSLRQFLVRNQGLPDLYIALAEDVLTIGLSVFALGVISG